MAIGLIGRKIGMSQLFDEEGRVISVTIIEAGPCRVVQRKMVNSDGYDAVQLGFKAAKERRMTKPLKGHFHKAGVEPFSLLREFRIEKDRFELGQTIGVDIFEGVDYVDVTGISKGKGFAGVMKRWGFHGGPASHGAHRWHRRPGSIGSSAAPSRVFKGKKMPGHFGNIRTTVQNLHLVKVDKEHNLLLVKGAVPGAKGRYLIIRKAKKR